MRVNNNRYRLFKTVDASLVNNYMHIHYNTLGIIMSVKDENKIIFSRTRMVALCISVSVKVTDAGPYCNVFRNIIVLADSSILCTYSRVLTFQVHYFYAEMKKVQEQH